MLSHSWILILFIALKLTLQLQAILQGRKAEPNQFPYMVSLRERMQTQTETMKYNHFCGAAMISERWIISAAHCLHGKRLNVLNIWAFVEVHHISEDGQKYSIERIITHEEFNRTTAINDVSLLQTVSSIVCDENVRPIPISKDWIKEGRKGVFAGFGAIDLKSGLSPSYLQYISLFVIPNDRCIEVHSDKYKNRIQNSILCTFIGHGAGPCRGDSGGILAINNQLVGILSWIIVSEFRLPDQFTRISEFVTWIEEKTLIKII